MIAITPKVKRREKVVEERDFTRELLLSRYKFIQDILSDTSVYIKPISKRSESDNVVALQQQGCVAMNHETVPSRGPIHLDIHVHETTSHNTWKDSPEQSSSASTAKSVIFRWEGRDPHCNPKHNAACVIQKLFRGNSVRCTIKANIYDSVPQMMFVTIEKAYGLPHNISVFGILSEPDSYVIVNSFVRSKCTNWRVISSKKTTNGNFLLIYS